MAPPRGHHGDPAGAAPSGIQSATVKRTLELAPGDYTLETAVGDRLGGGLSVQRTALDVASAEPVVSP